MSSNLTCKIRPAGRHVLTIGRDLIQDPYAAIVELVKNAYDADSPDVHIEFKTSPDRQQYKVVVQDHGHGMAQEVVTGQWLVPSTDKKLHSITSPEGRVMQGRKGIGRYAAAILGDDLLLETVTAQGKKTTVYIEWRNFEEAEYLDQVEILVENTNSKDLQGTTLTITGDADALATWTRKQLDKLIFELKKLMSPVAMKNGSKSEFSIYLKTNDLVLDREEFDGRIEPYPIFDLFDYKIAGTIDADGKGLLSYRNQRVQNSIEEQISFDYSGPTGCGEISFDIRVYDREKEAIDSLINRGLRTESGEYVGRLQASNLLNDYNGIGVYRNGFRIRPLGDADFDWLKLNKARIQNPTMKIGSNQVIGYVHIQSEEKSGLIEKSARDGLKENVQFENLKDIALAVIDKLEQKRFTFRKATGLSRPAVKAEQALQKLFAYDDLKRVVRDKLKKGGVDKKTADEIIGAIENEEVDKNKIVEEIRETVAIYQGQATLGKIINVILHEGRRPLSFFKNQIDNLHYWSKSFQQNQEPESISRITSIVDGIGENANVFVKLFSRLDPLAAAKRSARKALPLKATIAKTLEVFEEQIKDSEIEVKIEGPADFKIKTWEQDIYAIFTNLADNSIYWMTASKSKKKEISITITVEKDELRHIDFRDSGPGIDPDHIASEAIFEPQFTTKPNGTGLGLAIAGEAASRTGLELKAFESKEGAYFRLQPKEESGR